MAQPSQWKHISIKVDLLRVAPIYVRFLRKTFEQKLITKESVVKKLLYRYEHYWLPLLAEWQQTDLEPPLDIRWMWHLHLLHLQGYTDYCKERFGRVLPHVIREKEEETQAAVDRTKLIWKDNFPDESYDVDYDAIEKETIEENGTKLSHLVKFSIDQHEFLYQIGLPHYIDGAFLFQAVDRYKQLLLFKKTCPDEKNLCLPYDIQLIWRIHMLHPVEYHQEINRILGNGFEELGKTKFTPIDILGGDFIDAWKKTLDTELFAPGTGPRGPRKPLDLVHIPKDSYSSLVVEEAEITINDLVVKDLWTPADKIITEARKLKESMQSYEQIFRVHGVPKQKLSSKDAQGLGKFYFDARANRGIEFHVYGIKKRCCTKQENHISTIFFNPRQAFANMSFVTQTLQIDIPKISYTDCEISFLMKAKAGSLKPHVFSLDRESFFGASLPTDLRPYVIHLSPWYGAITLVEHDDKAEFLVAKHSLTSKRGGNAVTFSCQVVKQEDLDLSAMLLYKNDTKPTCVGYSISAEQLPTKEQLGPTCPLHFEATLDDHAMMIRNHEGDFAVVVARWIADAESPVEGKVLFHVYHLQGLAAVDTFEVRDDEHHSIKMSNGTIVNLPTGKVTSGSHSQTLPEDLTLAFCVGTLFVTCQKKPMSMVPGALSNGSVKLSNGDAEHVSVDTNRGTSRYNKKLTKNKKMSRKRKMSASFTYLLACGLQIDAALYGSMGPSLASSRASSVTNLIKSASQGSLPAVDLNPEPERFAAADPVTSPVEVTAVTEVTVVKPDVKEEVTSGGDESATEIPGVTEQPDAGIVINVAGDGGVDNPAVVLDTEKPAPPVVDNPQSYMDVRL